jgi:hypothetical protein
MSAKQNPESVAGLAAATVTKVTNLFVNQPGPLPLTRAFTSSGGPLLIFASGSLSTTSSPRLMQMRILFDGDQISTCQEWINVNSHGSLVPVFLTHVGAGLGNHVIELQVASGGTSSDLNDYYNVTIIELS